MISRKIRVVLVAAACLGVTGAVRLVIAGNPSHAVTETESSQDQSAKDLLLTHSGYMVAVG